jgi:hypothetical protein
MAYSRDTIRAVNNTWQAIASDLLQACDECGEPEPDNECAVECCMDADRVVVYGGDLGQAAQDEFRARITEVGYARALRELARQLPYPLM